MLNIFESVINSNIPSINKNSIESFNKKFLLDIPDDKVNDNLTKRINDNYNTWAGWAIDIYHGSPFLHKIFA